MKYLVYLEFRSLNSIEFNNNTPKIKNPSGITVIITPYIKSFPKSSIQALGYKQERLKTSILFEVPNRLGTILNSKGRS